MYLSRLNKQQKTIFLELAYLISSVDGDYSDAESEMINAYCGEMNLSPDNEIEEKSTDEIIAEINKEFEITEKKIIIFEIVGLAMCDNKFDCLEKELLKKIQCSIYIEEDYLKQCEMLIRSYLDIQSHINSAVLE